MDLRDMTDAELMTIQEALKPATRCVSQEATEELLRRRDELLETINREYEMPDDYEDAISFLLSLMNKSQLGEVVLHGESEACTYCDSNLGKIWIRILLMMEEKKS